MTDQKQPVPLIEKTPGATAIVSAGGASLLAVLGYFGTQFVDMEKRLERVETRTLEQLDRYGDEIKDMDKDLNELRDRMILFRTEIDKRKLLEELDMDGN